jgi:hypothetical protein
VSAESSVVLALGPVRALAVTLLRAPTQFLAAGVRRRLVVGLRLRHRRLAAQLPDAQLRPDLPRCLVLFRRRPVGGLAGIWLGGMIADKSARSKGAYPLVPAIAFLISAPCFILAMNSQGW